jgi:hypothetical protein
MTSSNSGDFVSGLQDAIRQNPVSAALVGVGLLWMFTGGSKITAAAALLGPAARSAAAGALTGVQQSADAATAVGAGMRSLGGRVADSVQDAVSGTVAAVGDAASRTYDSVKAATSDSNSQPQTANPPQARSYEGFGGALHENLKSTLERQPLLLGAIGLAIGAGMAAAFPTTQTETEFAGKTADGVIAQAKDVASATVDKVTAAAGRTFEAVKDEAAVQGLSLQGAKEGAAAIGGKVKSVAQAAARGTSSSSS